MRDRQPEPGQQLGPVRALDREDGKCRVQVLDLDTVRSRRGKAAQHLGRVRGVGDEEDLVVAAQVGDQVVDDAAVVLAAQGVLRLAGTSLPRSLVRQEFTYAAAPGPRTTPLPRWLTSKIADPLAYGGMLLEHSPAGILDRHLPPAEVGHLGAMRDVPVVERRVQQHLSTVLAEFSGDSHAPRLPTVPLRSSIKMSVLSDRSTVTSLTLTNRAVESLKVDAVLVGVAKGPSGPVLVGAASPGEGDGRPDVGDPRCPRCHGCHGRGHASWQPSAASVRRCWSS